MPRGGAEAGGFGTEVPRRVPAAARAAAGPVGAGCVRARAQPPHPPPEPEPGETQRQEEEGYLQEAQAQGQERREDQHASRCVCVCVRDRQRFCVCVPSCQKSSIGWIASASSLDKSRNWVSRAITGSSSKCNTNGSNCQKTKEGRGGDALLQGPVRAGLLEAQKLIFRKEACRKVYISAVIK